MGLQACQSYLERFLGDLLHCQPAIFCKELQETNYRSDLTHTLIQETLVLRNHLQMLKVVLLHILGEVVHLEEQQD